MRFANEHRDVIVSAILRIHKERTSLQRITVEGLFGPSLVLESTVQSPGPSTSVTDLSRRTSGLMGGMTLHSNGGSFFEHRPGEVERGLPLFGHEPHDVTACSRSSRSETARREHSSDQWNVRLTVTDTRR